MGISNRCEARAQFLEFALSSKASWAEQLSGSERGGIEDGYSFPQESRISVEVVDEGDSPGYEPPGTGTGWAIWSADFGSAIE